MTNTMNNFANAYTGFGTNNDYSNQNTYTGFNLGGFPYNQNVPLPQNSGFATPKTISLNNTINALSNQDGAQVKSVQNTLNSLGYGGNENTLTAGIKQFQKDNGLNVDGIIEPNGETINKLNQIGINPQGYNRAFIRQPDTSNLSLHEELEARANGTIPTMKTDPNTGFKSWYYVEQDEDADNSNSPSAEPQMTNHSIYRNHQQLAFAQLVPEQEGTVYSPYGDDIPDELIDAMNSDTTFQHALQRTRREEGGYSNRTNDRGGETNFGISIGTYPNENIREMTRERADALLYRDFWNYNGINTLPDELAEVVFDNAVNQGGPQAIKNLHRALEIEPGDIIGDETRRRVNQRNIDDVINSFADEVDSRYNAIISNSPTQEENRRGWMRRGNGYRR